MRVFACNKCFIPNSIPASFVKETIARFILCTIIYFTQIELFGPKINIFGIFAISKTENTENTENAENGFSKYTKIVKMLT